MPRSSRTESSTPKSSAQSARKSSTQQSSTQQPSTQPATPVPAKPAAPAPRAHVVLGICGSIAAYKGADLCSKLVQAGYDVTAVMTDAAQKLVGPLTFEALTGRPVAVDPFTNHAGAYVEHIYLADRADVLVVAPATANFLGKAANGIADDVLSSAYLAVTCPVIVAPAMNVRMWNHSAVRRNLETLRRDGVEIVEPDEGFLACRDEGKGRLAPPEAILTHVEAALRRSRRKD